MHTELAAVLDSLYNVTRANRVIASVIWQRTVIPMRQIAGAILVGLAGLKAIGLVVVMIRGMEDRPTEWYIKQFVYGVTAASIGWPLLLYKAPDDTVTKTSPPN